MRRGATDISDDKKRRRYAVRRGKVMDALYWPQENNPYYADAAYGPSRFADVVEGAVIPCDIDMAPEKQCLPEDMGPAPDQVAPVREVSADAVETWGGSSPK